MPNLYVYAPITGNNWGQSTYCSGGVHNAGVLCCPIDIGISGSSGGTAVRFYGSSGIQSIKTTHINSFCATAPPAGFESINRGVQVNLYRNLNGQCYIGSVFYGHLQNRIGVGTYNSPGGLQIGQLVNNCACACSRGVHTHMTRSTNGTSASFACSTTLYAGSTWVYYFYINDGAC